MTTRVSSLIPSAQHPSSDEVKYCAYNPDTNQDCSLYRCKYRTSYNNEAADKSEQYRDKDKRLDRPLQSWLPEAQDNSTEHCQEEKRILRKSVEGQQDAHVSEQDVDC